MKKYTFEEYLHEEHAKVSTAFDDDMPDAFEVWLEQLDVNESLELAQGYGDRMYDLGQLHEHESVELEDEGCDVCRRPLLACKCD